MEHVDYPHEPGTLYDCEACESECFCEGDGTDWLCLFCSKDDA
jgi:hypothetical protein